MSRATSIARQTVREGLQRFGESSRSARHRFAGGAIPQKREFNAICLTNRICSARRPQSVDLALGRRRYATTLSTASSGTQIPPLPSRPSVHVTPPSLDRVKAEDFFDEDVQLIPPDQATLVITSEAVSQLALITSREPPDTLAKGKLALRIMVESGGCHGYQDTLSLSEERNVDDYVFQPEGVNCIPVVIDLVSLNLLKGSTLHFATELIGSSFRVIDNPQAKDGGSCGCGVSWEAKP